MTMLKAPFNTQPVERYIKGSLPQGTARETTESYPAVPPQPQGYRAFVTSPLPPNPVVTIAEHFGCAAGNGLRVVESPYGGPIISVSDIVQLTHVSFTAANALMRHFVERGILKEITGQARNRQFRYAPHIDLFVDR